MPACLPMRPHDLDFAPLRTRLHSDSVEVNKPSRPLRQERHRVRLIGGTVHVPCRQNETSTPIAAATGRSPFCQSSSGLSFSRMSIQ